MDHFGHPKRENCGTNWDKMCIRTTHISIVYTYICSPRLSINITSITSNPQKMHHSWNVRHARSVFLKNLSNISLYNYKLIFLKCGDSSGSDIFEESEQHRYIQL